MSHVDLGTLASRVARDLRRHPRMPCPPPGSRLAAWLRWEGAPLADLVTRYPGWFRLQRHPTGSVAGEAHGDGTTRCWCCGPWLPVEQMVVLSPFADADSA